MKILPTLRQLRYLVTVADTLHFGQAAERCLVTQSSLSAGIQELEALLGVTLIERRSRRQVVLTPLGEEIVVRARQLLRDAEELVAAASAAQVPMTGVLRLGVIPTIGPYVLPRALPAVRGRYPNLSLYLREEQTARLLDLVQQGALDAALLALPYDLGGLDHMELWEEDVVVALPKGHRLAKETEITAEALTREPLILLEDGHCLRGHALEACNLSRERGNEALQGTSLGTLMQMVANGLGLTLLPRLAVEVESARTEGVATREIRPLKPARTVALCWRRGAPASRNCRLLGEALKVWFQDWAGPSVQSAAAAGASA